VAVRNAVILLALVLSSCGPLSLAGGLLGGGPKVAANVQAAKTATQTVGQTTVTQPRLDHVQAAKVEQNASKTGAVQADTVQTVVVREAPKTPLWYWLLLCAAILLDSPLRWPAEIMSAIRRK
jgi:hypothetical protein